MKQGHFQVTQKAYLDNSYLYVQDGLIISCGVLYALCYVFYMARTYKDKTLSGSVEFLYAP